MKTFARAAVLGALLATSSIAAAQAQDATAVAQFAATTLNLSAYGEVRVAPDMATITLGVQTDAKTAQEAMRANAARMTQVIAALRTAGIDQRDIQTSNINLNAQYRYEQNQAPELVGYQASNNVTIRVLDLAKLGVALDAVVTAGANQIQGIQFGLRDPLAAENEARRKAVTALRAKAELFAQATGQPIARLVNLSESGGYTPQPPRPMAMMRMEAASDSTPVSGGELSVRVDVSGLYELAKR